VSAFSGTYREAREKFLAAAAARHADVVHRAHHIDARAVEK